jgi:drug/metabolite transporter (DMT)-like permease
MPLLALLLVLGSCALHATWNLLIKRAQDKQAFTALYLVAGLLIYLPLFLVFAAQHPVPRAGWACIAATGAVYVIYFLGLASAYRQSDLSVAYPLSRGLGPLLVVAVGGPLLGETPSTGGLLGLLLLLAGVMVVSLPVPAVRGPGLRSLAPAALVGAAYAAYSLIDKYAVSRAGVHPLVYVYLTFAAAALVIAPAMVRARGLQALRAEWGRSARNAIAVGALNIGAYLLVLTAMALPDAPAMYIVPVRAFSVLFGVWMGTGLLGEEGRAIRMLGAGLMVAGLSAVTLLG